MRLTIDRAIALGVLALACSAAGAQTLFKCTSRGGTIEYRESGCQGNARQTAMRTGTLTGLDPIRRREPHRMRPRRARATTHDNSAHQGRVAPTGTS